MSVSKTIYSGYKTNTKEFDVGNFVESILLFDTVLLSDPSVIPELIRAFGTEGVLRLLNTGLMGVVGGGASAQATYDFKKPGLFENRPLDRPLRFGFETIFVDPSHPKNTSAEERLEKDIRKTKKIMSIDNKDLTKIHDAIVPSLKIIDGHSLKTTDDFRNDISSKQEFVVDLLVDYLARESKIPIHMIKWRIKVEEVHDQIFQIDTNLGNLLRINDDELHEFFKKPFFEITGTNLQLHRMRAVNAASGLTEAQANITAKRFDFLSRLHTESDTRAVLTKILEVASVPTLEPGRILNIDALIKLRESDEARSFRDWIQNSQTLEESDIQALITGWRKRLGEMLKRKDVKGLRWLTSTGIGVLFGTGAGIGVSALDHFLGKFLPGMGPIGFIVDDYGKYVKQKTPGK